MLNGKLQPGVSAKDVILHIIGDISASGANYCSVEFHGDVDQFSVEERFTLSNMGVEMGAKNAVFPVDLVQNIWNQLEFLHHNIQRFLQIKMQYIQKN